jgi:protein kinase-like protein
MNPGLLDRIQQVLHPRYQVERELSAQPGSGLFLARDLSLKRLVAVKVVDRELAGETASRRFQREARILAGLAHPNIVAIHDIQDRDGLLYYVRDFLEGEPLLSRLRQGRLAPDEAVRLGRDLLGALGAAHRSGVIHGALRPEIIFCLPDRYVVADFGAATSTHTIDSLDSGAPKLGVDEGFRGDLGSVAAIVYLALTGRAWAGPHSSGWARWVGVPRRLRGPLKHALAPESRKRWNDAASFERALQQPEEGSGRARQMVAAAVGAGLIWGVWSWWPEGGAPEPIPRELAIVPFEAVGGTNDGADLAYLLQLNLDNLPGLSLTSARRVNQWWQRRGRGLIGGEKSKAAKELRAHWLAHGVLERQGDSLRARVTLYDADGRVTSLPEIRSHHSDLGALSDTLAVTLVRSIAPQLAGSYRVMGDLGDVHLPALRQFIRGDAAFQRDAWALAEQHFEAALALDSNFALAAWRLANVKHWRRLTSDDDLRRLYQRPGARLRPLDALLIEALREPDLRTRLSKLELAISRFPEDPYARLLYAEELFHRGPLVGRGLDEGTRAMADAIAHDSLLALAYDHMVLAAIRQGDRAGAKAMLAQRRRIGSGRSPGDPDVLALSQLAYNERFVPWRARVQRQVLAWTADSTQLDGVARLFRTAVPWFDLPATQVVLGDFLLSAGAPDSASRGSAHMGKALGLMTLGRPAQALAELDSAANLLSSPEARLQRVEWRVALPALGLPLPEDSGAWLSQLSGFTSDSTLGPRAAWTLALAESATGNTLEERHWQAPPQSAGNRARDLERFAGAMALAGRGRWSEALAASEPLAMAMNRTEPPDPFARSGFHLLRGRWLLAAGDTAGAGREWRWHENSDVDGWPSGAPQAGEVDGMLGVYARLLRTRLLLRPSAPRAERDSGCALVRRVLELWSDPEPAMQLLVNDSRALAQGCAG